MLHHEGRALVVDPGDARAVMAALQRLELKLDAILVTHHHADHIGGVDALRQATGALVYGPEREDLPEPVVRLQDGAKLSALGLHFEVLHVSGHTAGHLAYFAAIEHAEPVLFCGDTLFSAGCGRLFEGTPEQMLQSLTRLSALPADTRVCCAHEYTQNSLRFAQLIEPDNLALQAYTVRVRELRKQNQPTLPSNMALENAVNPFLRTHLPGVIAAVQTFDASACDPVSIFAALRRWRDQF